MAEYQVLHAKLHTIVKPIPITTAAIVMLATENHMKFTNPLFRNGTCFDCYWMLQSQSTTRCIKNNHLISDLLVIFKVILRNSSPGLSFVHSLWTLAAFPFIFSQVLISDYFLIFFLTCLLHHLTLYELFKHRKGWTRFVLIQRRQLGKESKSNSLFCYL